MVSYRKTSAAALRSAERRQREDEAPRLGQEVPELESLRLSIEERSVGSALSAPKHVRHIVVATAPALFLVACGDPRCTDGGHDITSEVMSALHARRESFDGEQECRGMLGPSPCTRVIAFTAEAGYRTVDGYAERP
jgi:hypothetical protein